MNTAELKKRAEAATPGPWVFEGRSGDHPLNDQDGWGCDGLWAVNGGFILGAGPGWDNSYVGPNDADEEYIVAANPAAILKLLAINAELVEALGVMTELCAIKYGNLDKDVYEWIQKSRELRMRAKAEGGEL